MTPSRHALIDAHASLVLQEIMEMSIRAQDEIKVQVGWMRRSQSQLRRYRNAERKGDK